MSNLKKIAVIVHAGKNLGGGLSELRTLLEKEGYPDPIWYEVEKSQKAPKFAQRAHAEGAEVIFLWGGDGTIQRCVDALADKDATLAILPAGTANLLAINLGIPLDLAGALRVGLHGVGRKIDTGSFNGEHFAVMAGTGFDAFMIKGTGKKLKERIGRLAYFYSGTKNLSAAQVRAKIKVDGEIFFEGKVSCVMAGNVSKGLGGVELFSSAIPDDGLLEFAIVTAKNPIDWARTLGRVTFGKAEKSPFVKMARGKEFKITVDHPFPYEVDGSTRPSVKKMRIKIHPHSITIQTPGLAVANNESH